MHVFSSVEWVLNTNSWLPHNICATIAPMETVCYTSHYYSSYGSQLCKTADSFPPNSFMHLPVLWQLASFRSVIALFFSVLLTVYLVSSRIERHRQALVDNQEQSQELVVSWGFLGQCQPTTQNEVFFIWCWTFYSYGLRDEYYPPGQFS